MLVRREVALAPTPADGNFPLNDDKGRPFPGHLLQSFLHQNLPSKSFDRRNFTASKPQFSLARLTSCNRAVALKAAASKMDQGDDQMTGLPSDFDIDWTLIHNPWVPG